MPAPRQHRTHGVKHRASKSSAPKHTNWRQSVWRIQTGTDARIWKKWEAREDMAECATQPTAWILLTSERRTDRHPRPPKRIHAVRRQMYRGSNNSVEGLPSGYLRG